MKRLLILLTVLFVAASTSSAFNGERRGFVLGGGAGIAPICNWSVDSRRLNYDEQQTGIGLQLLIGHCWDNHNMIVYELNMAGFNSEVADQSIGQGFSGASWYHYFGPAGRSWFTNAGLGLYFFDPEETEPNDPSLGIQLGGGYEFGRHVQIGGYLSFGTTNDPNVDIDFNHSTLNLLFTVIGF